jgi:hypothetical protein
LDEEEGRLLVRQFCCHLPLSVACFKMMSTLRVACGMMMDELEVIWKEQAVEKSKHCHGICLE